ncbi:sigma 54-interacting transcriptional regulator [Aestuariivivens marinum]|uniref:sigma 54-interacting transcriptional regulator n=1 Tax=Aestuariivivens marinum TaxID=2913555 RepID=UPI001F56EB24|nr:sigma 54-interacting transcriptional regulator [Aestuariivivens marinum]
MGEKKRVPGLIALKQIIETTSSYTGKDFFKALVKHLAEILDVYGVWVTEFWPKQNKLNALAFYLDGAFVEEYIYEVANTPCEPVLGSEDICHIPKNVIQLYPKDPDLKPLGAVSYMGISLRDNNGSVIGHLALLDNKPMIELPEVFAIFKIFASRAAAELRREKVQKKIIESESKLNRLVNGTSDAIIEFNADFKITQVNEAATNLFTRNTNSFLDKDIKELFSAKSYSKLKFIIPQHEVLSNKYGALHINEPLLCINSKTESFPADINLSCYKFNNEMFYVLYIKNIKEQVSDKIKIKALNTETIILREKIKSQQFDYIIGRSDSIKKCLELVSQVGPTGANVLIQGETGTGKELFAKAVHDASERKDKSMITLNCAALPSELIESELFGHVKGAFTGAMSAREGRFSLADQSTLFLDEIGELPLTLQVKLLRVLQEGTFEPVGSSETKSVDVRIIAATHRDLKELVEKGTFREDLYYRLNVFPLQIPPLRERGKDIELLAIAFLDKLTKKSALYLSPLSKSDIKKLYNYHWPGNVRELQNVLERCVITSSDGNLNLNGFLPITPIKEKKILNASNIFTYKEMEHIERENIVKALNLTNWKISGAGGAAELLKIPRTTLTSKINKFSIKRMAM